MQHPIIEHSWRSRWGFALAAMSSSIGLANIWRFPYLVAEYGGGAFLLVYALCLIFAGFPLFIIESLIGRESGRSCAEAMYTLSGRPIWRWAGRLLLLTAFLVSVYYSVIAGWVAGYWAQSMGSSLASLSNVEQAREHYAESIASASFSWIWPQLFFLTSAAVVICGIRKGVERLSTAFMPLLFALLLGLVGWTLAVFEAAAVMRAILTPDWSRLGAQGVLVALGQAFFTLSLGQGTMITYGSYLPRGERLLPLAIPVVVADTLVSLLSTWIVFSACLQSGVAVDGGPGLVFQTIPVLFNQFSIGGLLTFAFFSLLVIATLTSEISVIEPVVSWLEPRLGRKRAMAAITLVALVAMALPAMSYRGVTLGWWNEPSLIWGCDALCTHLLIPLGGALALLFAHRGWKIKRVMLTLERTEYAFHSQSGGYCLASRIWRSYFSFCFKWASPILIALIFLHSIYGYPVS